MSCRLSPPVCALVVVGALALFGTACSDSSNESGSDTDDAGQYDADEVAGALIASSEGDEADASLALLISIDRGYDLNTVASAALAHLVTADGVIVTGDGATVKPQGPDAGLITDKPPPSDDGEDAAGIEATLAVYTQPEPLTRSWTVDELGQILHDAYGDADVGGAAGGITLSNILRMLDKGFSLEQVISAVVFGETESCQSDDLLGGEICTIDGERPAHGRQDLFWILETTEDDADPPVTDAGTDHPGTPATITTELGAGGRSTTLGDLESGSLTATVEGDTAMISVDWTFHIFLAGGPDELGRNCEARIRETVTGSGPTGDTTVPLTVEASALTDITGSQCDGGSDEFYLELVAGRQAEAKTGGTFIGLIDEDQIDGLLSFPEVEVFGTP
jgi:hypothetical protein